MTRRLALFTAGLMLSVSVPATAQIATTQSTDAAALAAALQGSGVTFTSSNLFSGTENGLFTGGSAATGIDSGVVLTTGSLGCVGAVNDLDGCTGGGTSASLALGFTATSTALFFNYAFASEEYLEFGGGFNDAFSLTLIGENYAGVNLAQLPGGGGQVSINNVNADVNSAFFRSNTGATSLGSGLIDHSQKMMVAARATAEKKTAGHRS